MKTSVRGAGLAAAVLLLACGAAAWGHAFLDHAQPKVGSDVESPSEVKIWFTEEIEPAFSNIQVFDAAGKQVDKKDFHLDPADKKLGIVSVGTLPPGKYKVVWHVVATDTHKTQGDFKFTVKAPAAADNSKKT